MVVRISYCHMSLNIAISFVLQCGNTKVNQSHGVPSPIPELFVGIAPVGHALWVVESLQLQPYQVQKPENLSQPLRLALCFVMAHPITVQHKVIEAHQHSHQVEGTLLEIISVPLRLQIYKTCVHDKNTFVA